ncbi:AAA-domain-containing protein [Leucogyrophana mollusca]|uniref:AAA-domain-containing protein n=1 Tax=Leucogyrophana mollusca TaxID=85980 RepID=A0ACB8BDH3_9AGAM|nr:AAA-domain-containing protein [Leucogyrophana mollusca]
MRSQTLIRRSRSVFRQASARSPTAAVSTFPRLSRVSRSEQAPSRPPSRVYKRLVSSTPAADNQEPPVADGEPSPSDPPGTEPEKPARRTRASASAPPPKDSEERPQLPSDLNVLWLPEDDAPETDFLHDHSLPPPELFDEALTNLHITLHPQTQHRAAYQSPAGPLLEPTLALYCPLEGGDYILDGTVKELARRTGSEVIVIDAVQLAAGECGHFGRAANSLQLPRNPLHFSPPSPAQRGPAKSFPMEDDDDDMMPSMSMPSQMTLHVLTPASSRRVIATPSSSSTPSRIKAFFDALVNFPSPASDSTGKTTPRRPRLIYIRDFPTLASTSSTWYPHLLSAVRQRRTGPIPRPTSPVNNPMTIVFGMTPPIVPPSATSPSGFGNQGLVNLLMRRKPPSSGIASTPRAGSLDWGEDEAAGRAREKRLKDRLRKWEKGDAALLEDLPTLSTKGDEADGSNGQRPGIVVLGGPGAVPGFPPGLESMLGGPESRSAPDAEATASPFFRAAVLVPNVRSLVRESACRTSRRREINELTMRMGVGAVGGVLEKLENHEGSSGRGEETSPTDGSRPAGEKDADMWHEWSNRVEVWSSVKQIADRAVGSVVSAAQPHREPSSLEPTVVPWSAIHRAWSAKRSSRDLRKSWVKESTTKISREKDVEEEHDEDAEEGDSTTVDETIESIKQDPDLDQHEQRLLSCIVDTTSLSTTFSQVHLPSHTIDSVRTIVSLPLLHPAAFQQGILKEHGMTGCLLFGPPGTGKTLVVRALAKEAGCRMMMVSPSDVMDMYVGEGEKLVKAVFSLARRLSPCVVFLDEIDALFGARMSARESGGAFAHRGVITEFMQEMDGLKTSKDDRVIVIGATNRPFDLDDAVLRRLPRRLLVDLPGEKEREEILKILLRDENLSSDMDLKALAKQTESFSGSDLKHLCVSAALDAVKEDVTVPWSAPSTSPSADDQPTPNNPTPEAETPAEVATQDTSPEVTSEDSSQKAEEPTPGMSLRTIFPRHFTKALKEITPSSSESLGSLSDLRKWNDEFGEGRRDKRRQQVWGKGKFGFIDKSPASAEGRVTTGHVSNDTASTSQ